MWLMGALELGGMYADRCSAQQAKKEEHTSGVRTRCRHITSVTWAIQVGWPTTIPTAAMEKQCQLSLMTSGLFFSCSLPARVEPGLQAAVAAALAIAAWVVFLLATTGGVVIVRSLCLIHIFSDGRNRVQYVGGWTDSCSGMACAVGPCCFSFTCSLLIASFTSVWGSPLLLHVIVCVHT
jgi:hypothetical protein